MQPRRSRYTSCEEVECNTKRARSHATRITQQGTAQRLKVGAMLQGERAQDRRVTGGRIYITAGAAVVQENLSELAGEWAINEIANAGNVLMLPGLE
jgi:hypothetical protein